jgi:hypothetical protein
MMFLVLMNAGDTAARPAEPCWWRFPGGCTEDFDNAVALPESPTIAVPEQWK